MGDYSGCSTGSSHAGSSTISLLSTLFETHEEIHEETKQALQLFMTLLKERAVKLIQDYNNILPKNPAERNNLFYGSLLKIVKNTQQPLNPLLRKTNVKCIGMSLQSIKYDKGKLAILDQLLLPAQSFYVEIDSVQDAWTAINTMQVRGAPAIAIVGCLSVAVELHAKEDSSLSTKASLQLELDSKLKYLVTARPTAVNLAKEVDLLSKLLEKLVADDTVEVKKMQHRVIEAIENLLVKDVSDNKAIGQVGANSLLSNVLNDVKVNVLTHCNTGSLATAGYGTALGVIRRLHELDRMEHVYCTETRPYMQGSRLTAYELVYEGIPSTLICDDMVAALFKKTCVHAVFVGADRVARNGDTANKIGTYQIAVLAKHHGVLFYVCAPLSSVDFSIKSGDDITIEERSESEMTTIAGQRIAAKGIRCWNPAFDVTPACLITGIVTEKGCVAPSELHKLGPA